MPLPRSYPGYDDRRVASLPPDLLLELNVEAVAAELLEARGGNETAVCV